MMSELLMLREAHALPTSDQRSSRYNHFSKYNGELATPDSDTLPSPPDDDPPFSIPLARPRPRPLQTINSTKEPVQLITPPFTPTIDHSSLDVPIEDQDQDQDEDDFHSLHQVEAELQQLEAPENPVQVLQPEPTQVTQVSEPFRAHNDVVSVDVTRIHLENARKPAIIGQGIDEAGTLVGLHVQSSDPSAEFYLHYSRELKNWEVYQRPKEGKRNSISTSTSTSVGWVSSDKWCERDDHHLIAGERCSSFWLANACTYAHYRERFATSGKVVEVYIELSDHLSLYAMYDKRLGWHLHEYSTLAFVRRQNSRQLLLFSTIAVYFEAKHLMSRTSLYPPRPKHAWPFPIPFLSSFSSLWSWSFSMASYGHWDDIVGNQMHDDPTLPIWRRRIRHLIRLSNDQSSEHDRESIQTQKQKLYDLITSFAPWLSIILSLSFLTNIGLRPDLPLFVTLISVVSLWPAFSLQNFSSEKDWVCWNVGVPCVLFPVVWNVVVLRMFGGAGLARMGFCWMLFGYLCDRVAVYRENVWAGPNRPSRVSRALEEFEVNMTKVQLVADDDCNTD